MRIPDEPLNAALESIAQIDVDSGSSVSFSLYHALVGAVHRTASTFLRFAVMSSEYASPARTETSLISSK